MPYFYDHLTFHQAGKLKAADELRKNSADKSAFPALGHHHLVKFSSPDHESVSHIWHEYIEAFEAELGLYTLNKKAQGINE
jgi:hypothetical protein